MSSFTFLNLLIFMTEGDVANQSLTKKDLKSFLNRLTLKKKDLHLYHIKAISLNVKNAPFV